jgi:prefoldin subunit 5
MADCKDIDAALTNLASKIDGLSNRLNDLDQKQKECCDKALKNNSDNSLEGLIRRIAKLENYVSSLESALSQVHQYIRKLTNIIKAIF